MIYDYWWILALVIGLAGYLWWVYSKQGQQAAYTELRELAYKLMLLAEKKFSSGEGQLKFDWVIEKLYELLPNSLKLFVDEEDLKRYIQELYLSAKDLLDDGVLNNS